MTKHVLSSARNSHFDYQREKEENEKTELNQRREADEMRQKEREQLIEQKASLTEKEISLGEKVKHSSTVVLDLLM